MILQQNLASGVATEGGFGRALPPTLQRVQDLVAALNQKRQVENAAFLADLVDAVDRPHPFVLWMGEAPSTPLRPVRSLRMEPLNRVITAIAADVTPTLIYGIGRESAPALEVPGQPTQPEPPFFVHMYREATA